MDNYLLIFIRLRYILQLTKRLLDYYPLIQQYIGIKETEASDIFKTQRKKMAGVILPNNNVPVHTASPSSCLLNSISTCLVEILETIIR